MKKNDPQDNWGPSGNVVHIHIFSHTHWDFEWYEIEEGFKFQLVRFFDHLLEILEKDPKFKFHFDGQVMPVYNYLEVLKERDNLDEEKSVEAAKRKISKFVQKGQLFIGPCWTTMETAIISTESLIRNINRGIRFSKKFGPISPVFYNADAFQYHSQVPQIIDGAGLKTAFTWRAYKEDAPLKDLTLWEGADKTTVRKYHPARTYAQIWHLPKNPWDAADVILMEAGLLKPFATTHHLLITQGNDQFEAQADLNEIIENVNTIIDKNYKIDQTTLTDFFGMIKKHPTDVLQGELTGNKWACTMSGQLSARMYLKQQNEKAEIAMEKWAEPFSTFGWLMGGEYPAGLIERAWEYLMKQHFHHCNACAVDAVHREGEVRYNNAIALAKDITDENLFYIASRIDTSKIVHQWESALVVFNPTGMERTGVVFAEINAEMVSQKTSDWQTGRKAMPENIGDMADLVIWDEQEERVSFQKAAEKKDATQIALWVDHIPPFGYKTYGVSFIRGPKKLEESYIGDKAQNVLENDLIKVTIHENGSFSLFDKRNGALYKALNILEDTADHGDAYNYDPLDDDTPITTKNARGKVSVATNGPLYAAFEVNTEVLLPESLTPDRKARAGKRVKLPLMIHIGLEKDSALVTITLTMDNRAGDHRVRALFAGVKNDFVYVQTQADVVKRQIKKPAAYGQDKLREITHYTSIGDLPMESGPSPTQFQRNFVGINDQGKGIVVFNKGLPEYEAKTNGTLALTLLRCIGWISQDDLKTRRRLAGPKIAVPDAQCIGMHTFEYAVMPQFGPWDPTSVYQEKNFYSVSHKSMQLPWIKGDLPTKVSFLHVFPEELMVSAVKKAYGDDHVIVRFYNPTGQKLKAGAELFWKIKEAFFADLNEKKGKRIPVKPDGRIGFTVGPKKIMTICLVPGDGRQESE
jgi:mannosylglycerate hydrolase